MPVQQSINLYNNYIRFPIFFLSSRLYLLWTQNSAALSHTPFSLSNTDLSKKKILFSHWLQFITVLKSERKLSWLHGESGCKESFSNYASSASSFLLLFSLSLSFVLFSCMLWELLPVPVLVVVRVVLELSKHPFHPSIPFSSHTLFYFVVYFVNFLFLLFSRAAQIVNWEKELELS